MHVIHLPNSRNVHGKVCYFLQREVYLPCKCKCGTHFDQNNHDNHATIEWNVEACGTSSKSFAYVESLMKMCESDHRWATLKITLAVKWLGIRVKSGRPGILLLLLRSQLYVWGSSLWVRFFLRIWQGFYSNHRGSHFPSSWIVRAGCVFVASIHLSRTRMPSSFEYVQWNACVHRLASYSHRKEF